MVPATLSHGRPGQARPAKEKVRPPYAAHFWRGVSFSIRSRGQHLDRGSLTKQRFSQREDPQTGALLYSYVANRDALFPTTSSFPLYFLILLSISCYCSIDLFSRSRLPYTFHKTLAMAVPTIDIYYMFTCTGMKTLYAVLSARVNFWNKDLTRREFGTIFYPDAILVTQYSIVNILLFNTVFYFLGPSIRLTSRLLLTTKTLSTNTHPSQRNKTG